MKIKIQLLERFSIPEKDLIYVVTGALYNSEWIFVRHRDRSTWEMPAGHIEQNESPDESARRELYEEAGVTDCNLEYLADYSVTVGKVSEFGRLYRAEVLSIGTLPQYEIAERIFSRTLPDRLTYPEVQTLLFNHL